MRIKVVGRLFFLALLFFCVLHFGVGTPVRAAEEKVWLLEQVSSRGLLKVFLGKNAVRVESPSNLYCVVCKSPDWRVMLYRSDDKLFVEQPLSQWRRSGLAWDSSSIVVIDPKQCSQQPVKYKGLTAHKIIAKNDSRNSLGDGAAMKTSDPVLSREIIFTQEIPASTQISEFLRGLHDLPVSVGVPLSQELIRKNGKETRFYTDQIKQVAVSANFFEYPKNFRRTTDSSHIVIGANARRSLLELGADMGIGEAFGTKKSKSALVK